MKSTKLKKHLKKLKKNLVPKFKLGKLLNNKKKKVKKLKKIKSSAQFKARLKLREQIAKQKQRENLAKIQVIKIRNQEKQRIKDEELKIKKQELRLKVEDLKLRSAEQK